MTSAAPTADAAAAVAAEVPSIFLDEVAIDRPVVIVTQTVFNAMEWVRELVPKNAFPEVHQAQKDAAAIFPINLHVHGVHALAEAFPNIKTIIKQHSHLPTH